MRQHSYILTETNTNDDPPIIVNDDKEEEKDRTLNNNKSISFEDDGCDEVSHGFSLIIGSCKTERRSSLTILFTHVVGL